MTNLKRNKRKFYLCNRTEENGRVIFSEPIELEMNYQPISMTGEIISFGSEFINKLILYTTEEKSKQFHNFDRCYIYKEPPTQYDKYCSEADFYVNGEPLIYMKEATIYLQRMTGDLDV